MTSGTAERIMGWTNRTVYDSAGEKIGRVEQVWVADDSQEPTWVTVTTGLFGMKQSFLPVEGLTESGNGDLRTPHSKDTVKDAPNVDPDGDHLEGAEGRRLHEHYGLARTGAGDAGRDGVPQARRPDQAGGTDDAMTRSEEHLRVGTEKHEAGRVRLRKYVTTETEQVQVPVTREEIRVEREPISEANRDRAMTGPEISESEYETTAYEERPVVTTETTPVERVRLSKEQVSGTETVGGEVRKEHIETEGDTGRDRR